MELGRESFGNSGDYQHSRTPEDYISRNTGEIPLSDFAGDVSQEVANRNYRQSSDFEIFATDNEILDQELANDKLALKRKRERNAGTYHGEGSVMITNFVLKVAGQDRLIKSKPDLETFTDYGHEYDDKYRGADVIILFYNKKTGKSIPIAIDTTTSPAPKNVSENLLLEVGTDPDREEDGYKKKLTHIKRSIVQFGTLDRLKYYTDPLTGEPIGRQEMPNAVVSFDVDMLERLARDWRKDSAKAEAEFATALRKTLRKSFNEQLILVENQIKRNPSGPKHDHLIWCYNYLSDVIEIISE